MSNDPLLEYGVRYMLSLSIFFYFFFTEVVLDLQCSNLKSQATVWKMCWICKMSHFYGQLFAAVGLKEDSVMLVLSKELWCGCVFF